MLIGDRSGSSDTESNSFHSEFRQVPDNQEVYLDKDGFSSIVIEILERVDKSDPDALKFHLQDIVEEDAGETKIWTTGQAHFARLPYVFFYGHSNNLY